MILHHLTAAHNIRGIRTNGLVKGVLPWNLDRDGNCTFRRPFQWLTANPEFLQQWCMLGRLPFPRNAYRVTVAIQDTNTKRLHRWLELVRRCQPDSAEEINQTGGDVENWWLYYGPIPPTWIIEITRNTGELSIAEPAPQA